jgi:hypothetical protein
MTAKIPNNPGSGRSVTGGLVKKGVNPTQGMRPVPKPSSSPPPKKK